MITVGTPFDDHIQGNNGVDDTLCGLAGGDHLYGASFADDIFGGHGPDVIEGDSGADNLHGGDGTDAIYGDYADPRVTPTSRRTSCSAGVNGQLLTA